MKIGVDGNLLCGKKTGMGTVVYNVLKRWESTEENQIVLFLPEMPTMDLAEIVSRNQIEFHILGKVNYFQWEQFAIPRAVAKFGIHVLWCPYNTAPLHVNCKTLVTIHDAIFFENPISYAKTIYKKLGILYRKVVVPVAADHAMKITTVSNYAKVNILKYLPNVKDKIEIVYNGVDFETMDCTENHSPNNSFKKEFILGFGSLESRKNTLGLIKAYEMLPKEISKRHPLVLFGFQGYRGTLEEKYILEHKLNVILLEYVSEAEKVWLYQNCLMFVFPSLDEGFGIPVLEAFAAGVPVITSCTSSLPEVVGDAAWLVTPDDYETIKNTMLEVLNNQPLVDARKELGYQQIKRFSWNDTANKIWNIVLEVGASEKGFRARSRLGD
ncbi:MAG: glycosyltransferase family 4 protein [Lachnospiraceae bacterium]|nr:glycosyltransferase family 4 protein [Lachnospiraceae bacterium]